MYNVHKNVGDIIHRSAYYMAKYGIWLKEEDKNPSYPSN